ncbi:MAG: cation:proton antiporter [Deltaproteobacteria bacterium]|jgi:Kef-type K+ transport system membrane component KefB|nr:cation:proton antiporter [Deltaproteobacteria bacterium]
MVKKLPIIAILVFFATKAFAATAVAEVAMSHRMTYLVLELAIIIIAARTFGFIFTRYLKQPAVLGELCAGMLIGPYALGSFDLPFIGPLFSLPHTMLPISPELYGIATVASIVLLFLVGLETDITTFLRYSATGSLVGLGGVVCSFLIGDALAVWFGIAAHYMDPSALFLGAISTATSVGITARILSEKRKLDSPEGVTILSGAVIDDVLGIVILAVVVGISKISSKAGAEIDWAHIGIIAGKALGFWIFCTAAGLLLARKITGVLKWFKSPDLIAALALGLALLLAGLSELAGLAMIIGAYITGLALSRTDLVNELHDRLRGVYQILVPIFFCVMGMLVNFKAMKGVLLFGLSYTILVMFGKIIGSAIPALIMRFNLRGALRIGIGMLPRGEVTLIITGIGLSTGIIGQDIFGIAIMMTLISTLIAPPLLIKAFDGPPGIAKSAKDVDSSRERKITLNFPNVDVAEFVMSRFINAFRNEAFFVHRIGARLPLYQLRKDDITMTMYRKRGDIFFEMSPRSECIARFIIAEEMLELEDAFESLKTMGGTKGLSADLISGALSWKA